MAPTLRARTRAAAVVTLSAGLVTALASPAFAADGKRDDGDMPGTTMSVGTAFVLFVLIPLAVGAIVWLLVAAPGWTRGGRASSTEAWTGDPLVVDGPDAPAEAQATVQTAPALGSAESDGSGGTSARW